MSEIRIFLAIILSCSVLATAFSVALDGGELEMWDFNGVGCGRGWALIILGVQIVALIVVLF